jgi:uncharacterized membrane protein
VLRVVPVAGARRCRLGDSETAANMGSSKVADSNAIESGVRTFRLRRGKVGGVDAVEVSTVVYLPPEEVYDFLVDFPRYANYSKYLTGVEQRGDGSPGTEYDLQFAWWKLTYTARSRVTSVSPPAKIEWEIIKDLTARGHWRVEEVPEEAPPDRETASRVYFRVEFSADSVDESAIDLPALVSLGWVVKKVIPLIEGEAERIVSRVVADLEGQRREVELTIHNSPDSV